MKIIDANEITSALGVTCIVSEKMHVEMQKWEDMYSDDMPWLSERVQSMRLPAAIAREIKRLVLAEFSLEVKNSAFDNAMQIFAANLRKKLDYALSMGGMLFKPYYTTYGVYVDIVPQNQFVPVEFTDDCCTAVICPESVTVGKVCYTRLEYHRFDSAKSTHTVTNRCFRSANGAELGRECSLKEVPFWENILPEKVFENVTKPLFSVFRMPDANHIDPTSPLGVSVYADAVGFIRNADEQWERILWELESSERAIDASEDLFRLNPTNGKPVLPKGRERMYHCLERTGNDGTIYNTFSPTIRDTSQFNALNQMLRRIENAVGLSYGTISEVSQIEKTAEEIRASKQRSFTRISDIQSCLKSAIEDLYAAVRYIAGYYTASAMPDDEITCSFGDSVLEDVETEFQRRLQLAQAGYLKPEKLLSWYFGCSDEDAVQMIPESTGGYKDLFGGDA